MSDENITDSQNQEPEAQAPDNISTLLNDPETRAQLGAALQSEVGPDNENVKANINKAYSEKEAMAKELDQFRAEKRESELRQLEESGKQKEADDMRMQEMKSQLKHAQDQVTNLTRDTALNTALSTLEFKTEKAAKFAQQDLIAGLVQDSTGNWVSSNGQSISDYAKAYQSDESNSFLFKAKQSSGSSTMATPKTSGSVKSDKPVSEMSNEELLAHFAK